MESLEPGTLGTTRRFAPVVADDPSTVRDAVGSADVTGPALVYEDEGRTAVVELRREWTRVGRSIAADVRFDDTTVSRRHALIVRQADGVRILDDRSLNGVYVNGERVEWRVLAHGDEIQVGRHRLVFVEHATVGSDGGAGGSSSPLQAA